ncbi:MAG: alkaline phosphatase, partial [Gammaproteobacteria bacterium]
IQTAWSETQSSKNLIIMIGDGMGPAQVTLARLYAKTYLDQEQLVLDQLWVGMNNTFAQADVYKNETKAIVSDSAAAATALATGHRTYNRSIAISNEAMGRPYASIMQAAKNEGKATGLITTTRVTHATPAAFFAHVRHRDMENAIASQYLDKDIDVILGGGEENFVSDPKKSHFGQAQREDGLDLITEFENKGYHIVYDQEALQTSKTDKLLGLFSASHIPYNIDRDDSVPNLSQQLQKALTILSQNDVGFVLLVEGGRIDQAAHANDAYSTILETLEFDQAIAIALKYAQQHPDTSLIVTADHETGGMSIARDQDNSVDLSILHEQKAASETISQLLKTADSKAKIIDILVNYLGDQDWQDSEIAQLLAEKNDKESVLNDIIAKRARIGWTSTAHTGVDVGTYAFGPVTDLLRGYIENTEVNTASLSTLELDLDQAEQQLQAQYLYPRFINDKDQQPLFPLLKLAEALNIELDDPLNLNTIPHQETNDEFYVSLEGANQILNTELGWDPLSERITLDWLK